MINRVLVIDDHYGFRTEISRLVSQMYPYANVFQARNGQEGIALALRERPDLILMDANMPVMNGLEAAKALRNMPETQLIPLVAMTLDDGCGSAVTERLRFICNGFLSKPFCLEELMQIVSRIMQAQPSESHIECAVHVGN